MVPTDTPKARRSEFLQTGLILLADQGPRVLTATRLAQELEVTTGSFYWHFHSVAQFHADLMSFWKDTFLPDLVDEAIHQAEHPSQLLRCLSKLVLATGANRFDDAMRAWAKTNPQAAVAEADKWRAKKLYEMVGASARPPDEARERVDLMGTVWRGSEGMKDPRRRVYLMKLAAAEDGDS